MIDFEDHMRGVILPVRAQSGAKANGIRGIQAGHVKISVTQVAEKGKANRAIRDLLARELQVAKSSVELISGESSRRKRFLVHGFDRPTLESRIVALLPGNANS